MKQKIVVILILLLTLVSCKKEFNFFQQENENGLPNYGNVDVENVFTAEDSQLQDKQNVVNAIQQYYDKVWEKGDLSGGFLVAKGDKILFESYRGFAKENNQVPINKDVPLHIASISKSLTAMAVLKLVEARKINLHDKVTHYFPKFPYKEVEVIHLLNHRSGLPKISIFHRKTRA